MIGRRRPVLFIILFLAALAVSGCSKGKAENDGAPVVTVPQHSDATTEDGRPTQSSAPERDPDGPATVPSSAPAAVRPKDPVPVGTDAELMPGVVIRISDVQEMNLKGRGPGDASGPGIAVTVLMRNDSRQNVDFAELAVVAETADGTPLTPSRSAPASVPSGRLGPRGEATAIWTFHTFGDPAGTVIQASHPASPSIVQFKV